MESNYGTGRLKMKTVMVGLALALGIALVGSYALGQGMGSGMMGGYGGYGQGSGMMGGYGGYGQGYGLRGGNEGYGRGPGANDSYGGYGPSAPERNQPVTRQETEAILQQYIGGNPHLKIGSIKDKGNYFEGTIVTRENSLVADLRIDKSNGSVTPLN
jgi:hypothetical protein